MTYCTACLAILPADADICPECGIPVTREASGSHNANFTANLASTSTVFYSGYDDAIPYLDVNAVLVSPGTQPTNAGALTVSSTQNAYATASMAAPLQFPVAPIPKRRSRWSVVWRIALICFLCLFLLVESASFALYAFFIRPIDFQNQAALVTNTYLANQGQQLANSWRTLSPAQVYAKATSGAPVIDDALAGPDGNVWYNYLSGKNGCSYENGAYHVRLVQAGGYDCIGYGTYFHDLVFQANVTMIRSDSAALDFRYASSGAYIFAIVVDGSYQFDSYSQNANIKVIRQGYDSAINTDAGQTNQLTIIAIDKTFYFYINRQFVVTAQDKTYSQGQIAFSAGSNSGTTDVAFSNVKVWKLA